MQISKKQIQSKPQGNLKSKPGLLWCELSLINTVDQYLRLLILLHYDKIISLAQKLFWNEQENIYEMLSLSL